MIEIDDQFKNIQVFVYCGGKCGSQTLYKTLSQYFTTGHFHNQENFMFHYNITDYTLFDIIDYNSKIYDNIYIIDSYRTPIERKISCFFNNINHYFPNITDVSTTDLINFFNKQNVYTNQEFHPIDEIMNYYNVDSFKTFDFENKYNIYKKNNIHFIKIRFNDIQNWDKILQRIFKRDINIIEDNMSINKDYINKYIEFKKQYDVPKDYLNNCLSNDLNFKIYNTNEEQKQYYEKLKNYNSILEYMSGFNLDNLIKHRISHINKYNEFNKIEENIIDINEIIYWVKNNAIIKKQNGETFKILELGTKRSINNSPTTKKILFSGIDNIEYIMTDYQNGLDVDIVCDLHKIDGIFERESFDLIISCSTFEHLKYPQLCSHNLMKILKIGGRIYIQTHQTYPLHGYKYDYFRFSRECLKAIFSKKMNFSTIATYFTGDCVIIPHTNVNRWNNLAESYLNVNYIGEKNDKTPEEYIYDIECEN